MNSDLLAAGVSGVCHVGAELLARPTDLATPPAVGWNDCGWISDAGLTENVTEKVDSFIPWGSGVPARKIITSSEEDFDITFWETNEYTLALYNRKAVGSLTATSGVFEVDTGPIVTTRFAALFDIVDGFNHVQLWLPSAEVTGRKALVYAPGKLIGYPTTITAYPDSTGMAVYKRIKVGATS